MPCPCQMLYVPMPSTLLGVNLNESPVKQSGDLLHHGQPELCKHHWMSLTWGSLCRWTPLPSPAFLLTVCGLPPVAAAIPHLLQQHLHAFLPHQLLPKGWHCFRLRTILLSLLTVTSLDDPSLWESPLWHTHHWLHHHDPTHQTLPTGEPRASISSDTPY